MIIQPDFPTHWKTQLLTNLCQTYFRNNPTETQGLLLGSWGGMLVVRLWAHCQQRKAWIFPDMTPETLAAVCDWRGDPVWLRQALEQCVFIEKNPAQVEVHEWDQVNGRLVHNWEFGKKGGRPKKPKENPRDIQKDSEGSPTETLKEPIDKIDKIRSTTPVVPKGTEAGILERLVFPTCLDTGYFRKCFGRWIEIRMGMKKSKQPVAMFQLQLKQLARELGSPDLAVQCLEASVAGGWQGLFPQKISAGGRGQNVPVKPAALEKSYAQMVADREGISLEEAEERIRKEEEEQI